MVAGSGLFAFRFSLADRVHEGSARHACMSFAFAHVPPVFSVLLKIGADAPPLRHPSPRGFEPKSREADRRRWVPLCKREWADEGDAASLGTVHIQAIRIPPHPPDCEAELAGRLPSPSGRGVSWRLWPGFSLAPSFPLIPAKAGTQDLPAHLTVPHALTPLGPGSSPG